VAQFLILLVLRIVQLVPLVCILEEEQVNVSSVNQADIRLQEAVSAVRAQPERFQQQELVCVHHVLLAQARFRFLARPLVPVV